MRRLAPLTGLLVLSLTLPIARAGGQGTLGIYAPPTAWTQDHFNTFRSRVRNAEDRASAQSVPVFYPDHRLPYFQTFRLEPAEAREYRQTFGIDPVGADKMQAAIGPAYVLHQVVKQAWVKREELAWLPSLAGELIQAKLLDPDVSRRELERVAADVWSRLWDARTGRVDVPFGYRLPVIATAAVLGVGSGTAVALRAAIGAATGDYTDDLITRWYAQGKGKEMFDSRLRLLEQVDGQVAFNNLAWAVLYAGSDRDFATVLSRYTVSMGLPAVGGMGEEQLADELGRRFPEYEFSTYSDVLSEHAEQRSERTDAGDQQDSGSPRAEPALSGAPALDLGLQRVAGLAEESAEFDEGAWRSRMFAADGLVRLSVALMGSSDPRLGAEVARVGGAGLQIAQAAFNYQQLSKAGLSETAVMWASVGMYATVASIGLSLLQGPQEDGTAAALKQIMRQLETIQKTLNSLYEMAQLNFAHLDRRMVSIHGAMMQGFDDIHAQLSAAQGSVVGVHIDSKAALTDLARLQATVFLTAESEIDGRYSPDRCYLTARGALPENRRLALFEECMESMVQQLGEPRRSDVLVRGSAAGFARTDVSSTLAIYLRDPEHILWYEPQQNYPLNGSALPYQFSSLGQVATALGARLNAPVPRANPGYWMKYTDMLLDLVSVNADLLRSSSVARIAVDDAIRDGKAIVEVLEDAQASNNLLPALTAAVDVYGEAVRTFAGSVRRLEGTYFERSPAAGVQYLDTASAAVAPIRLDNEVTVMMPCDTQGASWAAKHSLVIPYQVREVVPRAFRVAEANGHGVVEACYSADYEDQVSVSWNYNTPNSRVFTARSFVTAAVTLTFISGDSTAKVRIPVLKRSARSVDRVSRESLVTRKGCDWRWSFSNSFPPGSSAVYAEHNEQRAQCRATNATTVYGLDAPLSTLATSAWTWDDAVIESVPATVETGIDVARQRVQRSYVAFVAGVLSTLSPSARLSVGPAMAANLDETILQGESFIGLADRVFLRSGGVVDQLRELELRRSFILALLETFLPAWKADSELTELMYSSDWRQRLLDGPFLVSLLGNLREGDRSLPESVTGLVEAEHGKHERLREALGRVTGHYAGPSGLADLEAYSWRLAMLQDLSRLVRGEPR